MTSPKLLGAVGAGVILGASGVFAVAIAAPDHHRATAPAVATATPTRPIADDGSAQRVYDGAKDSVAYISANTAAGPGDRLGLPRVERRPRS